MLSIMGMNEAGQSLWQPIILIMAQWCGEGCVFLVVFSQSDVGEAGH